MLFRDIKKDDFQKIKWLLRNPNSYFYSYKQIYIASSKIIRKYRQFEVFVTSQLNIFSIYNHPRVGTINLYGNIIKDREIVNWNTFNLSPISYEKAIKSAYLKDLSGIFQKFRKVTYYQENGGRYVGHFKNGKFHGHGMFLFLTEGKYIGNFENDKYQGYGIKYYSNGNRYCGNWKSDLKDGNGTFIWKNGDRYVCVWKENQPRTSGILVFSNGVCFEGTILSIIHQNGGILIIEKMKLIIK